MNDGQQHQPQSKENGQHQSQGTVILDSGPAGDGIDKQGGQQPGHKGAQQHDRQFLAPGDQEGQGDAWQGGVGNRVTQQALFSQYGEAAQHTAAQSQQRRTHDDGPVGIVRQETENGLKHVFPLPADLRHDE